MARLYVVKELAEETQPICKFGLKWGVYEKLVLGGEKAVVFCYEQAVAVAVAGVMNDGGWKFKPESEKRGPVDDLTSGYEVPAWLKALDK